jgi:hypothetical protein
MNAAVYNGTAAPAIEITTADGTATATFDGVYSAEVLAVGASDIITVGIQFIATVTGPGTLVFQALTSSTTGTPLIKAQTYSHSYSNATGYTALKVA